MGIEMKSIGMIFDEFLTVSQKLYHVQEDLMDTTKSTEERLEIALKIQGLNSKRNQLIRAIDTFFGQADMSFTDKTYTKHYKQG